MSRSIAHSDHFEESAYERDLKGELLGLPPKRKLRLDAVPMLCLKRPAASQKEATSRAEDGDHVSGEMTVASSDQKIRTETGAAQISAELKKKREEEAAIRAERCVEMMQLNVASST